MPLATKIELAKAKLLEETRRIAINASGVAASLNRQSETLLSLDNGDLTAFLQGQGEALPALLSAHKETCDGINAVIERANATLQAAGQPEIAGGADATSLVARLAAQGRNVDMQTLTVS